MADRRRYTIFQNNEVIEKSTDVEDVGDTDVVNGTIRDVLNNLSNIHHLYDVIEFNIMDQTYIDDPLIANAVRLANNPKKLVLTIYDDNGTVERHYVTNGTSVKLVKQKDSFHNRIIFLVNERLQQRGLNSLYVVNDLTGSNLTEINQKMVNFLDQL